MPSLAYKETLALSYSGMKPLRQNPARFRAWQSDPDNLETRDMALGSLCHLLLLEPHREKEIVVWEGKVRNGKVWDKFQVDNAENVIVLPKELLQAKSMVKAVRRNPLVLSLLQQPGLAEHEFHGTDSVYKCPVKCAFDWITADIILDLKKCALGVVDFEENSIWKYQYHVQAAFYLRLAELMDGRKRSFGWIVVEDYAPYNTVLLLPGDLHLELGNRIVDQMLERFSECWRSDSWPGYAEHMRQAEVPEWRMKRLG